MVQEGKERGGGCHSFSWWWLDPVYEVYGSHPSLSLSFLPVLIIQLRLIFLQVVVTSSRKMKLRGHIWCISIVFTREIRVCIPFQEKQKNEALDIKSQMQSKEPTVTSSHLWCESSFTIVSWYLLTLVSVSRLSFHCLEILVKLHLESFPCISCLSRIKRKAKFFWNVHLEQRCIQSTWVRSNSTCPGIWMNEKKGRNNMRVRLREKTHVLFQVTKRKVWVLQCVCNWNWLGCSMFAFSLFFSWLLFPLYISTSCSETGINNVQKGRKITERTTWVILCIQLCYSSDRQKYQHLSSSFDFLSQCVCHVSIFYTMFTLIPSDTKAKTSTVNGTLALSQVSCFHFPCFCPLNQRVTSTRECSHF